MWRVSVTVPFGNVISTGNSRHVHVRACPRCQSVRGSTTRPRAPVVADEPAFAETMNESSAGVGAQTRPQSRYVPASFTSSCHDTLPDPLPFHRGPAGKIRRDALSDLSKSTDPAIRHYSGKVVYRTTFMASKPSAGEIARLSFGGAREIARVKVNGREAGGIWTAPYEVQVTDLLRDGENNLEVEVCTSWVNRLVGDAALPAEKRPTWISVGGYKANHPLVPSGLFGPTRLVVERH